MRILALHIESFGKLHDFDLSLSEGLNCLCHPNGWGKTTLSVFIKAMLYGLPASRAQDLQKNERGRYSPWQGGVYGGWLAFETEGQSYRVERTFGATAAKDRFSLYTLPAMEHSNRYTDKLGEELFGIDADSFERSLFYSERHDLLGDDYLNIQNKISSMGDLTAFNGALKLLDRERKKYVMTGSRGQIAQTKEEIYRLEAQLAEAEREAAHYADLQEQMASLEANKTELEKAKEALEARLTVLGGAKATEAYRSQAESLKASAEKAREAATRSAELPCPTAEELDRAKEACQEQIDRATAVEVPAKRSLPILSIALGILTAGMLIGMLVSESIGVRIACALLACLGVAGALLGLRYSGKKSVTEPAPTEGEVYLSAFLTSYPIEGETTPAPSRIFAHLMMLERNGEDRQRAERQAAEAEAAYQAFMAKHPELVGARSQENQEVAYTKALDQKQNVEKALKELTDRQMSMQRQIAYTAREAEQLPQIRQSLREKEELLPELKRSAKVIEKTREYLETAKQRLSERYLDAVQDRFADYVARLSKTDKEIARAKYRLTSDFAIRIEEKGQIHEMVSMSAGTAELLTLCLRLALSDALFPDQKPPLLLDDPFAEYDDGHLATALSFLDTLKEDRQVIYLVCHSSRCK